MLYKKYMLQNDGYDVTTEAAFLCNMEIFQTQPWLSVTYSGLEPIMGKSAKFDFEFVHVIGTKLAGFWSADCEQLMVPRVLFSLFAKK